MAERLSTALRNELLKPGGKSLADLLANGRLDIRSGAQPTSADAAETGTLLNSITLASGAFTPGQATNGLNFGAPSAGVLPKETPGVWSGVCLADGTAGHFRFYANDVVQGANATTAIRMDGAISTSGAEINMSNLAMVLGGTTTIDGFNITLPAA